MARNLSTLPGRFAALASGERIRHIEWGENEYIEMRDCKIYDETNMLMENSTIVENEGWEMYTAKVPPQPTSVTLYMVQTNQGVCGHLWSLDTRGYESVEVLESAYKNASEFKFKALTTMQVP